MKLRVAVSLALWSLAPGCNDICEGPACEVNTSFCPADDPRLRLEYRWVVPTDEDANPEILRFVPGDGNDARALVTTTLANEIREIRYDEDRVEFTGRHVIDTGNFTSELTSMSVHPTGRFAAITVSDNGFGECETDADCGDVNCVGGYCQCLPDAPPGCACGRVLFVDIDPDPARFGTVLASVSVGYAPDSGRFSPAGDYFVTADEDDKDDRACRPSKRDGGSVSILQIGNPPAGLCATDPVAIGELGLDVCRIDQIVVSVEDGEPEDVAIGPDGQVVVAIQELDQLGFFRLDAIPDELEILELDSGAGPDGMEISASGAWVAVGLEHDDSLAIVDMATHELIAVHSVRPNVPLDFNRDLRKDIRHHEPEQVALVQSGGEEFVVMTLQESHAIIAYRIDIDEQQVVVFDSIQPVGIGFRAELGGTVKSKIRPEGLAARTDPATGRSLFLVASEGEGSVTLLRSACPRP